MNQSSYHHFDGGYRKFRSFSIDWRPGRGPVGGPWEFHPASCARSMPTSRGASMDPYFGLPVCSVAGAAPEGNGLKRDEPVLAHGTYPVHDDCVPDMVLRRRYLVDCSAHSPAGPDGLQVLVLQGLADDDGGPVLRRVVPRVLRPGYRWNTLKSVGVDRSALGFGARGVPKVELAGGDVRLDGGGVKRGRCVGRFRCGHHRGACARIEC